MLYKKTSGGWNYSNPIPLSLEFHNIYIQKIIPLHKKGPKDEINNYRPVANLNCMTKIYEKLVLQRIMEIEEETKTDLTGKNQHEFKRGRSTKT